MSEVVKKVKLPSELAEIVKKPEFSGLSKAEKIAANYAPFMEQVQEQIQRLKALEVGNPLHLESAKRIKLDLGKICSAVDKQKDKDKEMIKIEGNLIQSFRNVVEGTARITQKEAEEIEKFFENQEKERLAKLQEERVALILPYLPDAAERYLSQMPEDVWDSYFAAKQSAYHDLIAAEKAAEESRLEKERLEALGRTRREALLPNWDFVGEEVRSATLSLLSEEEFSQILETSNLQKQEFLAEQERVRKQAEDLQAKLDQAKKEQEEKEAKVRERSKALQPYIIFIRDYDKTLNLPEDEFKKELADLRRALEEQTKFELEQKRQFEEQQAKIREAEEAKRKEAQRIESLKKQSHEKQVLAWIDSFQLPEFTSQECDIVYDIKDKFEAYKEWARELLK
jgi:hypothetical protein